MMIRINDIYLIQGISMSTAVADGITMPIFANNRKKYIHDLLEVDL